MDTTRIRHLALGTAAAVGLAVAAMSADAATLLVTDSSWQVTTAAPGAGWNSSTSFNASAWSGATQLFNLQAALPGSPYTADAIWTSGGQFSTTEVAIWGRKVFNLATLPSTTQLFAGIDDDGDVYVNGILVGSSHDGVAGWAAQGLDITSHLVAGDNVIAFAATDNWPVWGYNHQFWAQLDATFAHGGGGNVPEPASAALLLLGLGGLLGHRRVVGEPSATAMPQRRRRGQPGTADEGEPA